MMEIDNIFESQGLSALAQKTKEMIAARVNEKLEKRIANMIQMLRDANLNSQNKILTMVIYKHHNQLRKQKSLQYAKRIANLTSKLETLKIVSLLECVKDQFKDQHLFNQLKNGVNEPSSSTDTANAVRQLICKSKLTKEILKSCEVALSLTRTDLGSGTFVTFYTFIFAHLSRIGIIMACIHEEFIELFKLLLEVQLDDVILKENLKVSAKEQFNSMFSSKSSQNEVNRPKNSNILEENEDESLKGQYLEENIHLHDMGEIVPRKAFARDEQVNRTKAETADVEQNYVAAKPRIKKISRKVSRHNCICWKCCQNRRFFRRARQRFLLCQTSLCQFSWK